MLPTASPAEPAAALTSQVGGEASTSPSTLALETRGLRKVYGRKAAVEDLSLEVQPGEVFGFLGPNGAGKTTTVKMLLGLTRPSSGQAFIFGAPAGDPRARQRVGYLPELFRFHDWLCGQALLDFHGQLAGMAAGERRHRVPEVLALVGLGDRGGDLVRNYSKGMTQRLGLAQAILHRPDLVLLDEPTSALDPLGRREVRDLIRDFRAAGMTVFLNSHLLSEVEMVCDRVAIVDRGRVVRSGPLAELLSAAPEVRLTVDRVDDHLRDLVRPHGEVLRVEGTTLVLGIVGAETTATLAEAVVRAGYRLYGLVPTHQSLEDVFVTLVEGRES